MLLWINGPFGIGKSSTASALRDLSRDRGCRAWIYDPEIAGFVLQRVVPRSLRPADFREQRSWRWMTRTAVAVGSASRGLQIVPMTIHDPDLLAFLTAGRVDRVVQLTAPREVISARIQSRGHDLDWCLDQLARWPDSDALGTRIDTHGRAPDAVATEILRRWDVTAKGADPAPAQSS